MTHSPVRVRKLHPDAIVPTKATAGSAAYDIYAYDIGMASVVGTGIALDIDSGWYVEICSRSGLAAKHGIFVLNAPGIVDSDYKGEIKVILSNAAMWDMDRWAELKRGDRIAQMVIRRVEGSLSYDGQVIESNEARTGGLGSTGA